MRSRPRGAGTPRRVGAVRLVAVLLVTTALGCGDGPLPTGPLTTDEAVAACVAYTACMGGTVTSCFAFVLPTLDGQQARCVARAGSDCLAAGGCFGASMSLGQRCEETSYSCDGSTQVMCTAGGTVTIDCTKVYPAGGPLCVVGTSGQPYCGVGTCSASEIWCEGDLLVQCLESEGVAMVGTDCAVEGMTCAAVGELSACIGTGAPCEGATSRCEGSAVVSCVGGFEAVKECTDQWVEGVCVEEEVLARCALGQECDPTGLQDTCVGDSLTFCAAGVTRTVACSAFGLGPCQEGRCSAYQFQ